MEEAPCYVFKSRRDRPIKRRRLNETSESDLIQRNELFARHWGAQNQHLNEAINKSHNATTDSIVRFIHSSSTSLSVPTKIPTGLLVTDSSSSSGVFESVISSSLRGGSNVCVTLSSSDGPNLKSLLKNLISRVTQEHGGLSDEDDERPSALSRGSKLLNYDLQILYDWYRLRDCPKIVIALNNSETFDVNVLTAFVTLLHSWLDRLPVVLLIGIATSVDMFHDRTPVAAIKCMQGEAFDISETDHVLEEAFRSCTAVGGVSLHIGPNLGSALLQRSRDYGQSVEAFRMSMKYAHMCHFYGNPATSHVKPRSSSTLREQDLDAIRHLPSFQQHVEQLLARKEAKKARQLLKSDAYLRNELATSIANTNTMLEWLCGALSAIQQLRRATSASTFRPIPSFSSLYTKALSGHLGPSSPQIRDLLLSICKLSSESTILALEFINDTLLRMPPTENAISPDDFSDLHGELMELIAQHGPLKPLSQPFTPSTTRTATSSHTKSKPLTAARPISKAQQFYASILDRLHTLLTTYFTTTLPEKPYTSIFAHELLFLDTKARALHRGAMTPSPRTALERALSAPHDYLGCACCGTDQDGVSTQKGERRSEGSSQPATAILYQLYLEAGSLVNVGDLWTAFRARIAPSIGRATQTAAVVNGLHADNESEDEEPQARPGLVDEGDAMMTDERAAKVAVDETLQRALFFRALAELKYVGMVKTSRRKVDCVQKVMWKGL